MRIALAVLFVFHALAHLVFFAAPWGLGDGGAPTTVLSGAADLGAGGARALGVLWLLAALAFFAAAVGAFVRADGWRRVAVIAGACSLALSIVGWPGSMVGVPVNLAILAVFAASRYLGWMRGDLTAG